MKRSSSLVWCTACCLAVLALPTTLPAQPAANQAEPAHPQLLLRSLEQRLGANPFDPVSLNNLAVIRMAEGDPLAAAELLSRAAKLAPEHHIIGDNQQQLNQWLSRRLEAGDVPAAAEADDTTRPFPPEPPPIWPRP